MSRSTAAFVAALLLLSAEGLSTEPTSATVPPIRKPEAGADDEAEAWRAEARAAIRRLVESTDSTREAAARRLLDAYRQIPEATGIPPQEKTYWQDLMANRLRRASRQLAAVNARRAAPPGPLAQFAADLQEAVAPGRWAQGREILAQQIGPGAARPLFGPAAQAAPTAAADYGDDLVDIIQSTIAPASWDVNGGPGAIRYYRPLRVLVVRQTDEVHELIGGVIGGLRQ